MHTLWRTRRAPDTSGPALRSGCAARPLLVKPNVVEAEEFTGACDPAQ